MDLQLQDSMEHIGDLQLQNSMEHIGDLINGYVGEPIAEWSVPIIDYLPTGELVEKSPLTGEFTIADLSVEDYSPLPSTSSPPTAQYSPTKQCKKCKTYFPNNGEHDCCRTNYCRDCYRDRRRNSYRQKRKLSKPSKPVVKVSPKCKKCGLTPPDTEFYRSSTECRKCSNKKRNIYGVLSGKFNPEWKQKWDALFLKRKKSLVADLKTYTAESIIRDYKVSVKIAKAWKRNLTTLEMLVSTL